MVLIKFKGVFMVYRSHNSTVNDSNGFLRIYCHGDKWALGCYCDTNLASTIPVVGDHIVLVMGWISVANPLQTNFLVPLFISFIILAL